MKRLIPLLTATFFLVTGCGGSGGDKQDIKTPPFVLNTSSVTAELNELDKHTWQLTYSGAQGGVSLVARLLEFSDEPSVELSTNESDRTVIVTTQNVMQSTDVRFQLTATDTDGREQKVTFSVTINDRSGEEKASKIEAYATSMQNVLSGNEERRVLEKITLLSVVNESLTKDERDERLALFEKTIEGGERSELSALINEKDWSQAYYNGDIDETKLTQVLLELSDGLAANISPVNALINQTIDELGGSQVLPEFTVSGYYVDMNKKRVSQWYANPTLGQHNDAGDWVFNENVRFIAELLVPTTCDNL
jgi:hypothetical protein